MPIVMNSNVSALTAQRYLDIARRNLDTSLAKLSSGMRIVRAADDAAGMGISEVMRAQIRGLAQAGRNANDGVSMAQVAEGAMNEQAAILTRLRELAVQSANGTLTSTDRQFIDKEAKDLTSELDRISTSTEYDGWKILMGAGPGGASGNVTMQVGIRATANDTLNVTFNNTGSVSLGVVYSVGGSVDLATSATSAQLSISNIDAAIATLSSDRAQIGADTNRLQVTINNLASARENLVAAQSRIRDVDVASETAEMTRAEILAQAGTAVLAQANQLPSAALSLLRG